MRAGQRQSINRWAPDLPRIDYDREQCVAHRILVPDWDGPANRMADSAYRMLRTRVLQRARANQWTTLAVTSPGAGEGKSVTALNLALAIAREQNNNVFLLDLDLRSPKICRYLGVAPPVDLQHYFTGDADPHDVLFSVGIGNLTVAGTRISTEDSSELLSSGRVEDLFQYIRDVAPEPLVLLDLPPILVTDDALVIAPKVDACLLVLAEGLSRRDSTEKSLELLAEYSLAGIVLNRSRSLVPTYYGS